MSHRLIIHHVGQQRGWNVFSTAGKNLDDPLVMFGDIAVPTGLGNADPCTARGCLWPKASDGNVYVPFRISRQFCKSVEIIHLKQYNSVNKSFFLSFFSIFCPAARERDTIIEGLRSFAASTCIRFTPLNGQRDFVDIESRSGYGAHRGVVCGIDDGSLLSLNLRTSLFQVFLICRTSWSRPGGFFEPPGVCFPTDHPA